MTTSQEEIQKLLEIASKKLAEVAEDNPEGIPLAALVTTIVREIESGLYADSDAWRAEVARVLREALGILDDPPPSCCCSVTPARRRSNQQYEVAASLAKRADVSGQQPYIVE